MDTHIVPSVGNVRGKCFGEGIGILLVQKGRIRVVKYMHYNLTSHVGLVSRSLLYFELPSLLDDRISVRANEMVGMYSLGWKRLHHIYNF